MANLTNIFATQTLFNSVIDILSEVCLNHFNFDIMFVSHFLSHFVEGFGVSSDEDEVHASLG